MRTLARLSGLLAAAALTVSIAAAQTKPTPITVYKTPTCGCCAKWVEHLKASGFAPTVHDMPSVDEVKNKAGVPADLRTCHTAMVNGYVIEGHVPADVIRKLLKEHPDVAGLAVPGMPMGSPGMDQGGATASYDVIAFKKDGTTGVYAKR